MSMTTFSIRDLREHTGELVRTAEAGELSVVAKHGRPLFVAVPLTDALLKNGVHVVLAAQLFRDHVISLGRAAKIAGMHLESFMDYLADAGIPIIDYDTAELADDIKALS